MTHPSLRERKKARTRLKLMRVAEAHFREKGYAATSLEEICEEVEVSTRTLLRYFESKDQLALARYQHAFDRFRDALHDPDRDVDTVTLWRNFVEESATGTAEDEHGREYLELIHGVPTLAAGALAIDLQYEDLLTEALAGEAGVDPDVDLHSRLLAAMLVAGNQAAARRWAEGGGEEDLRTLCLETVDFAVENFRRPR